MSIWVIVLLLGVVAMVVGPVMLLQPSPQDRRQTELRTRARKLGLVVRLETLPVQATDLEAPERLPVYRLPAQSSSTQSHSLSWQLLRAPYRHETHFLGDWRWQGQGRPGKEVLETLEQSLATLPKSVLALGGDSRGWYLAWTEEGGVTSLAQLAALLRSVRQASQNARPAQG